MDGCTLKLGLDMQKTIIIDGDVIINTMLVEIAIAQEAQEHLNKMFDIDTDDSKLNNGTLEVFSKVQNIVWSDIQEKYSDIYMFINNVRNKNDIGETFHTVHESVLIRFNELVSDALSNP